MAWELGEKPEVFKKPQKQGLVSRARAAEGTEGSGDPHLPSSFTSAASL